MLSLVLELTELKFYKIVLSNSNVVNLILFTEVFLTIVNRF